MREGGGGSSDGGHDLFGAVAVRVAVEDAGASGFTQGDARGGIGQEAPVRFDGFFG